MATNPQFLVKANTRDRSGEKTALQANQPAALDVSVFPVIVSDFLTAFAAYTELIAGNITTLTSNAVRRENSGLRFGVGHREVKWKLHFTDTVNGNAYSATIPLATNLDAISEGTDFLPNSAWVAPSPIEAAAEALFYSPDGNVGNLVAIELVRGAR